MMTSYTFLKKNKYLLIFFALLVSVPFFWVAAQLGNKTMSVSYCRAYSTAKINCYTFEKSVHQSVSDLPRFIVKNGDIYLLSQAITGRVLSNEIEDINRWKKQDIDTLLTVKGFNPTSNIFCEENKMACL